MQVLPARWHAQWPSVQLEYPQHSEPFMHSVCVPSEVSAGKRQQLLRPEGWAWHKKPLQHSPASPSPQVSPGGLQPGMRQRPPRHSSPPQQPSFEVQLSSCCPHAQRRIVPPSSMGLHCAPPQQSVSSVQVSSPRRQTQRLLVQSIEPQHSRPVVQAPIAGRQQKVPPGCWPHARPEQHTLDPCVHIAPLAMHIPPSPTVASIPVPPPSPVPPPPSLPPGMSMEGTSPAPPSLAERTHRPPVQARPAQHSSLSRQE